MIPKHENPAQSNLGQETSCSCPSLDSDDLSSLSGSSDENLTLEEFVIALPDTIRNQEKNKILNDNHDDEDLIGDLFQRLALDKDEYERFSHFDTSRKYTRNLISTDAQTYTLLLLCWNPNCSSPIHDHPCNGCWMRVCEGTVAEARYVENTATDKLELSRYEKFEEGGNDVAFIADSLGYHKVENPSRDVPAVTMHLYSPPFEACKVWMNGCKASKPILSTVCYFSEYGRLI